MDNEKKQRISRLVENHKKLLRELSSLSETKAKVKLVKEFYERKHPDNKD